MEQKVDRQEFKNQLLVQMTESVLANETREYRRDGCLDGISISRDLVLLEDYERVLIERQAHETAMRAEETSSDVYWRYRCATVQVEYVLATLKAFEALVNGSKGETLSAQAMIRAAFIVRTLYGGEE